MGAADTAQPHALPPHLRHLVVPVPIPVLGAEAPDEDFTWAYAWPVGQRLAAELTTLVPCRGAVVADLGCGRGHLGLSALVAGAERVVFADRSATALAFVQAVLTANGLGHRAACACHQWGDPIPGGPFDLIVGGDILYRPALFTELFRSIATSLRPDGICLLSDPRQQLDAELPALAQEQGLRWAIRQDVTWATVGLVTSFGLRVSS
jgi:2-polyprenyl-3-methyl-5-hydroxy-6-metoxy-1,4-benzoquinol methylase